MCGILGAIAPRTSEVDLGAVQRGLKRIRHRGPDGEGIFLFSSVDSKGVNFATDETPSGLDLPSISADGTFPAQIVLGQRRLSILDLSVEGHQPMSYASERFWIVYNGEVYNYVELRDELVKLGYEFRSDSDTEVILAAYEEWGTRCFARFLGMFSLVIFDRQDNKVVLARDHFGIKPLFYSICGETLVFSSEIKGLFEYPGISRKCNTQALYEYLRFGLTDHCEQTMFAEIRQLPSSHFAEIDLAGPMQVSPKQFWSIKLERPNDISFKEATTELRRLLEDSVSLHMRSDVPVGSCLSGGLDSTAIVAAMVGHMGGVDLPTFTYIADDEVLSEAKYVDIAVDRYKVLNFQTKPTIDEISAGLPDLISVLDQPFGGWSMFAQHKVFELAHDHQIKVILDGQGSDEMFGGYTVMLGARASGLLAQGKLFKALELLKHSPQNMSSYKRQMVLMAFGRLVPKALQPIMLKAVGAALYPDWCNQSYFEQRGTVAEQRPAGRGSDALRQELKIAVEEISLPRLLRYEDRNSMFFSIESRVPFCNPRIAEFAFSLPPEYLVSDKGETKYVLREAMRDVVPDQIIDREKVGFAVPERKLAQSMRGWVNEQINLLKEMNLPFLQTEVLVKALENHISHSDQTELNQYWRPINVALWAKEFNVEF
ncbi:MAG: asparagine synthase (glutamine-hydrolyzing) [Fimbriimonas sp.]|jgi:asparagine synthase (glutamine-hydrolysing)|nr:asparagine synthase (glutamine-hydrolyzing) [Fimbriimonas sp.]